MSAVLPLSTTAVISIVRSLLDIKDKQIRYRDKAEFVKRCIQGHSSNVLALEALLQYLVETYPAVVTCEMLDFLIPVHLKTLNLSKCTNAFGENYSLLFKRLGHLRSLIHDEGIENNPIPDRIAMNWASQLPNLTTVSLSECPGVRDNFVSILLFCVPNITHLSIARCQELTDAAFLNERNRSPPRLASLDISGCDSLTNTTIRLLTELCGSSLRHLNVAATNMDCTILWYLAGHSLASSVRLASQMRGKINNLADAISSQMDRLIHEFQFITEKLKEMREKAEPEDDDGGEENQPSQEDADQSKDGRAANDAKQVASSSCKGRSPVPEGNGDVSSSDAGSQLQNVEDLNALAVGMEKSSGGDGMNEYLERSKDGLETAEDETNSLNWKESNEHDSCKVGVLQSSEAVVPGNDDDSSELEPTLPPGEVAGKMTAMKGEGKLVVKITSVCSSSQSSYTLEPSAMASPSLSADIQSDSMKQGETCQVCEESKIMDPRTCASDDKSDEVSSVSVRPKISSEETKEVVQEECSVKESERQCADEYSLSANDRCDTGGHSISHSLQQVDRVQRNPLGKGFSQSEGVGFLGEVLVHERSDSEVAENCNVTGQLILHEEELIEKGESFSHQSGSVKVAIISSGSEEKLFPQSREEEAEGASPQSDNVAKGALRKLDDLLSMELDEGGKQENNDQIQGHLVTTEGSVADLHATQEISNDTIDKQPLDESESEEESSDGCKFCLHNSSEAHIPKKLFEPHLLSLNINMVELHGDLVKNCFDEFFAANSCLQSVTLGHRSMTNELLQVVADHCSDLNSLTLVNCSQISSTGLAYLLKRCKQMKSLFLQGVPFLNNTAFQPIVWNESPLKNFHIAEVRATDFILRQISNAVGHTLKEVNLNWCEDITSQGILEMAKHCPNLESFSIRQLQVSENAILSLAKNCPKMKNLDLSGVEELTDTLIVEIMPRFRLMKVLDVSWTLNLTDTAVAAILACCPLLTDLNLAGLKRITEKPFLPIISDINRWRRCQSLITLKLKEKKMLQRTGDEQLSSDEEYEDLYVPVRSTSYAPLLQRMDLQFADLVKDKILAEIVAVCCGSLEIIDYYGLKVSPKLLTLN